MADKCRLLKSLFWKYLKVAERRVSMKSKSRDHETITAGQSRQEITSDATVISVKMLSGTVKALALRIQHPELSFKAGQWVDFFIPNMEIFTGYSMCSTEKKLKEEGIIDLAVKCSEYAPTKWVHNKCEIGSEVKVRVGGNFYYDPQADRLREHSLLLIAGGVGINPLISIFRHAADLHKTFMTADFLPKRVHLMYSVRSTDELIFKDDILNICSSLPNFSCDFFVTRCPTNDDEMQNAKNHRVQVSDIAEVKKSFGEGTAFAYVCGPPEMLMYCIDLLKDLSFKDSEIKYEKWWQ